MVRDPQKKEQLSVLFWLELHDYSPFRIYNRGHCLLNLLCVLSISFPRVFKSFVWCLSQAKRISQASLLSLWNDVITTFSRSPENIQVFSTRKKKKKKSLLLLQMTLFVLTEIYVSSIFYRRWPYIIILRFQTRSRNDYPAECGTLLRRCIQFSKALAKYLKFQRYLQFFVRSLEF